MADVVNFNHVIFWLFRAIRLGLTPVYSVLRILSLYLPVAPTSNQFYILCLSEQAYFIQEMPTPESAAFLARKPKVPPTFSGVDYDDNARLKAAQDAVIREQWVKCMMARLIRDELGKCYRREGVNHLEKCAMLRERYFKAQKEGRVRGYLFEQQNYLPGDEKGG